MQISIYTLKPRFQALLRPLVARLARLGVSANQVTLLTCAISVLLGAVLFWWPQPRLFLALPFWMLLRMALNAIDGMLAREFGQQSRLGGYLNELGDVVADAALILPFVQVAPFAPAWVVVVALLTLIAEYAGVLGPMLGAARRYDGPMGKSDRAFVFGVLGLWFGLAGSLPALLVWLMPMLTVLLAWTAVNRVRAGLASSPRASSIDVI